jgi:hypothetical protein
MHLTRTILNDIYMSEKSITYDYSGTKSKRNAIMIYDTVLGNTEKVAETLGESRSRVLRSSVLTSRTRT